jgi:hypothetical protein
LGLCYLGGNYVAIAFDKERAAIFERVMSQNPSFAQHPSDQVQFFSGDWLLYAYHEFSAILKFDAIPQIYVTLSALALILSYFWARRHTERLEWLGYLVASPGVILLGFTLIGGALYLIVLVFFLAIVLLFLLFGGGLSGFADMLPALAAGVPLLVFLGITYSYYRVCMASVAASRVVVLSWAKKTT